MGKTAESEKFVLYDEDGEFRLNPLHFKLVNEYYDNGFKKKKAIETVYGIKVKTASNELRSCICYYDIFKRPEVQRYMKLRRTEMIESAGITAERTMKEIADIAYGQATTPLTTKEKLEALKLISKLQGLDKPKETQPQVIEVSLKGGETANE